MRNPLTTATLKNWQVPRRIIPKVLNTILKPCPFCGAEPSQPENTLRTSQRPSWEISCSQFCVAMFRGSKKEVVESWNRRTP